MGLVALAHGVDEHRLLAAAAPALRRSWVVDVERFAWGSVLVAGLPTGRADGWLVAGRPSRHPWGVPGHDLPCKALAAGFARHGAAAVQLAAGAFVAIDLEAGAITSGLSGLVPMSISTGERFVASTAPTAIRDLGELDRRLRPGDLASPSGLASSGGGGFAPSAVRGITWGTFDAEVREMVGPSARLVGRPPLAVGPVLGPAPPRGELRLVGSDVVWLPSMRRRGDVYSDLRRHDLGKHWLAARCVDAWMFAPSFERPALSLVADLGRAVW